MLSRAICLRIYTEMTKEKVSFTNFTFKVVQKIKNIFRFRFKKKTQRNLTSCLTAASLKVVTRSKHFPKN